MGQIPQNKRAGPRFHAISVDVKCVTGPRDAIMPALSFRSLLGSFHQRRCGRRLNQSATALALASDGVGSARAKKQQCNYLQETVRTARIPASLVHGCQRRHPESGVAS